MADAAESHRVEVGDSERPLGRVLVIDDEPVVADVLGTLLGKSGYELKVATTAAEGRAAVEDRRDWDVVLLDLMLPDASGLQVLRWLGEAMPEVSVVMITAFASVQNAVDAMRAGAFHYLTKPFNNDAVRALVAQAVQTTRLRRENQDLRQALDGRSRFERLVGQSRAMQKVYGLIEQVAPSRATVLIEGESGTGKELVAQAIHSRSKRSQEPFVVVNSSSIPADLLEDNLFGHSRGAFTGADSDKPGLLEMADGGTMVFDEITTIPAGTQAKLLRVMQDREFLPLGALESRRVDVRIVAATNDTVRDLVAEGRFREDLYYRLNVISVTLPPLRERREDLPLLITHFLERFNRENEKDVQQLAPDVMERFLTYRWPGNVRELENAIERGVVLSTGGTLTLDLLPPEIREAADLPVLPQLPTGVGLSEAMQRYERQLIQEALRQTDGVQKRAAEILGVKPTTLNEKIKRLGLSST